jgi:hypothetical protein
MADPSVNALEAARVAWKRACALAEEVADDERLPDPVRQDLLTEAVIPQIKAGLASLDMALDLRELAAWNEHLPGTVGSLMDPDGGLDPSLISAQELLWLGLYALRGETF